VYEPTGPRQSRSRIPRRRLSVFPGRRRVYKYGTTCARPPSTIFAGHVLLHAQYVYVIPVLFLHSTRAPVYVRRRPGRVKKACSCYATRFSAVRLFAVYRARAIRKTRTTCVVALGFTRAFR